MDERIQKVVSELIAGTRANKINWEKTARKSEFRVRMTSGLINVDKWSPIDDDTGEPLGELVDVTFMNAAGETIDRFAFSKEDGKDFSEIAILHELARRNALKIDETLDSLFKEISEKAKS